MTHMRAWLLALATVCSLLLIGIPVFLMNPLSAQTEGDLALSYGLCAWSPLLTLTLLALGIFLIFPLWRRSRSVVKRASLGAAFLLLVGAAVLARQNHIEWMFRPLPAAGYVEASAAEHLQASDLVLGIQMGEEARAYPVRLLAYHHLVNDELAGVAFVATY